MKISLDDRHVLLSDPYCCWVEQTRTSAKGKEYTVRVSGYCMTVGQALESYINKKVLSSGAEDLRALNGEIEALKAEVLEMCSGIDAKILEAME